MIRLAKSALRASLIRQRRRLRQSEAAFVLLASIVGLVAGILTIAQQGLAHGLQRLLYGVSINRLSALGSIHHPWKLIALPIGGLLLALLARALRNRQRAPVDVVEANAMHGGRIPFSDNLIIAAQTILSNGAGASVGLEAAYAQMGGGFASQLGQWFALRRNDLRTLVGAGSGAAIGAAFGAPLTGAFYAFEIVIGNYTPAAIAPVMAASLVAVSVIRIMGVEPYLIATSANRSFPLESYVAYAGLGLACALIGIVIMRLVTAAEIRVQAWPKLARWRPVIGGFLLIPLALISPQTLSAGHGALHLDLTVHPALTFLVTILALKIAASVISLSFGFRGGLFFASLFLGSLVGQVFAVLINMSPLGIAIDPNDAALVGMAALSVSIVGGPMTLALLMLETTHDFSLMGVVLTATLISSAITREVFGYSFSTWRLHLRGSNIRSPRDIGWALSLTAERIMRRDWEAIPITMTIGEFRTRIPLGAATKTILTDNQGRYRGIVLPTSVHQPDLDETGSVAMLAVQADQTLRPQSGIDAILRQFEKGGVDELAVVDSSDVVIGVVTEKYARQRYFNAIENAQRELFGETSIRPEV